jgi:3-methyladenine DNA glycosylase/8-oxoguanine DNA glycosylase
VTATFAITFPLDLRQTLAPLGGHFRPDGWWTALRTGEGPATLHLRRQPSGVVATGYGPGASSALELVPGLIGAADAPETFRTDHPLVAELHRRHPGWRFGQTGRVFDALLRAIVEQKVTGREAGASLRALGAQFGDPAPGPARLRLPPDPARLAELAYHHLHPLGIERRRAVTIIGAARRAGRLEALGALPATEARAHLERLGGVGGWTSAKTVAVSHGDPDAVAVGDFHLKNEVVWHLCGRPRGTDEEMLRLLEEFRPHRGRVIRLLQSLGHAPAYGPRQPVRGIARI